MLLIALLAALAMVVQDILYVLLTQAEARNRAGLAGVLDAAGYLASLVTTVVAVNAINGHDLGLKLAVLGAVTIANFVGAYTGVLIGERFVKEAGPHAYPEPLRRPTLARRHRTLRRSRHDPK